MLLDYTVLHRTRGHDRRWFSISPWLYVCVCVCVCVCGNSDKIVLSLSWTASVATNRLRRHYTAHYLWLRAKQCSCAYCFPITSLTPAQRVRRRWFISRSLYQRGCAMQIGFLRRRHSSLRVAMLCLPRSQNSESMGHMAPSINKGSYQFLRRKYRSYSLV